MNTVLPSNWDTISTEVICPNLTVDFMELGGMMFPIQVPVFSLEQRLTLLAKKQEIDKDERLVLLAGNICRFFYPQLSWLWPEKVARLEELRKFVTKVLEKNQYNNEFIKVCVGIYGEIKWKKQDPKQQKEFKKYAPMSSFGNLGQIVNLSENKDISLFTERCTRGFIELVKLQNAVEDDLIRQDPSEKEGVDSDMMDEMASATTLEAYEALIAKQQQNNLANYI